MLEEVPDSLNMVHGDYHTNNVHYANGEAILIDMDTLSVGNSVFEFSNFYLAYHGFGELDHSKVSDFLKIDWDLAQDILKKVFAYYFEDKGPDYIEASMDKAQTVGFLRLYRRSMRRDPDNAELIAHCRERLIGQVDKVDSLAL